MEGKTKTIVKEMVGQQQEINPLEKIEKEEEMGKAEQAVKEVEVEKTEEDLTDEEEVEILDCSLVDSHILKLKMT